MVIPAEVSVDVQGQHIKVKGAKGELAYVVPNCIALELVKVRSIWLGPTRLNLVKPCLVQHEV